MAVHSSTELSNGHLLTVTSYFPTGVFRVEERNECGTMLHVAFTSSDKAAAVAWCDRAADRGYGLRPTIGRRPVVADPASWRRVAIAGRRFA